MRNARIAAPGRAARAISSPTRENCTGQAYSRDGPPPGELDIEGARPKAAQSVGRLHLCRDPAQHEVAPSPIGKGLLRGAATGLESQGR